MPIGPFGQKPAPEPAPDPPPDEPTWQAVFAWRYGTLLEAGYEPEHAEALAGRTQDVDLHAAVELVQVRGCPPTVAARVLL